MAESENPLFEEEDGATALRPDLVRFIGFAAPAGADHGICGAASAVWNGRHGYVALLVRRLDTPSVTRFVYREKISSEASLLEAMGQTTSFAASFGLTLVRENFSKLDAATQERRLDLWNEVRKPTREPRFGRGLGKSEASADPAPAPEGAEPPAVLGRLEVLRVDADKGTGLSPLGRLLSYF